MNAFTDLSRRDLLRRTGIVGLAVVGTAALGTGVARAEVRGFRWCSRCQSLWFSNGGNNGHCPVEDWFNHSHYQNGSNLYKLRLSSEQGHGQGGWHWCATCKAVWSLGMSPTGAFNLGFCPNNPLGGSAGHRNGELIITPDGTSWDSFRMEFDGDNNGPGAQRGWRFCRKCNVLFFILNGLNLTHCPKGGQHEPAPTDFWMRDEFH